MKRETDSKLNSFSAVQNNAPTFFASFLYGLMILRQTKSVAGREVAVFSVDTLKCRSLLIFNFQK